MSILDAQGTNDFRSYWGSMWCVILTMTTGKHV